MVKSLYKSAYHANWFLIFHHNSNGGYFSSNELLMYYSEHKYSALETLEKYRINGYFEFLLEYPQLDGYNRFIQKSNPTKTASIEGYRKKHLSWELHDFGGLALSSDPSCTYIDGSPGNGNDWFYSIGLYNKWDYGDIPGPYNKGEGDYYLHEVNLWIRIYNLNSCKPNHRNHINSLLFITLFFS